MTKTKMDKMFKKLYYASDSIRQILPFLRKERWRKNLAFQRCQHPHSTTAMISVHLLHIKKDKKSLLFSPAYFWTPALKIEGPWPAVVTATSAGNCELALTMVASPAVMASSAQWLFQQARMLKQTLFRRKPPDLSLTISKGGDVSQVLSADLCNILHHNNLPG